MVIPGTSAPSMGRTVPSSIPVGPTITQFARKPSPIRRSPSPSLASCQPASRSLRIVFWLDSSSSRSSSVGRRNGSSSSNSSERGRIVRRSSESLSRPDRLRALARARARALPKSSSAPPSSSSAKAPVSSLKGDTSESGNCPIVAVELRTANSSTMVSISECLISGVVFMSHFLTTMEHK